MWQFSKFKVMPGFIGQTIFLYTVQMCIHDHLSHPILPSTEAKNNLTFVMRVHDKKKGKHNRGILKQANLNPILGNRCAIGKKMKRE